MTLYATTLGTPAKISADKKFRAYKTPYGYEVYRVMRELIWSDLNLSFKVGKKLEAVHVFNIADLDNLEWGIEEHTMNMKRELEAEFGKAGA